MIDSGYGNNYVSKHFFKILKYRGPIVSAPAQRRSLFMYQDTSRPITREGFLRTPGRLVVQGQYIQADSPTLSSSRVRWVQLSEWVTFVSDFTRFWDALPSDEKNEIITNTAFLEQYSNFIRGTHSNPTNEDMLSQHLDSKYATPHNWAARTSQTMQYPHARIIRRDSFYQTVGKPDYLFVEQEGSVPRALYSVMELKTFWKVTAESIAEVLNGNTFILSITDQKRDSPSRDVTFRKIGCRTDVWIHGSQRKTLRRSYYRKWMDILDARRSRQIIYNADD